jgi:hypothetical protein
LASPRQFSSQPAVHFPLGAAGEDYSVTPQLPLSMTPHFTGICVPGVDLAGQKHAFLQTLAVICGKSSHLELKYLQFTHSSLGPGEIQDSDF